MTRHDFALYRLEDNGGHREVCSDCAAESLTVSTATTINKGCRCALRFCAASCAAGSGVPRATVGEKFKGSTWHGDNEAKCTRFGTWEMIQ